MSEPLTLIDVILDAAPLVKAMMLGLTLAGLAAVAVTLAKLWTAEALGGGSAFVSGLRAGGPLAGLVGAVIVALPSLMLLAGQKPAPPFSVVAPGLAEAALVLGLGLLAGLIAVVGHTAVAARIDRLLLKS